MTRKIGPFETKFVYRQTWHIKTGMMDEFIRLITSGGSDWWADRNVPNRAYISEFGVFNVVAWEAEFESLEAYEKAFDEWTSSPKYAALWSPELNALIAHGGTREGWIATIN